jgi:acetoin utilization protein AcuB
MKLKELMTRAPLSVRTTDDVGLALQVMAWAGVRHLPVLRDDRVLGVVSERDLLRGIAAGGNRDPVTTVMSTPAKVASPEDDVIATAKRLAGGTFGCVPILDGTALVGMVTRTDLVAALAAEAPQRTPLQRTLSSASAAALMTRDPAFVHPEDGLLDAAGRMAERQVRHLPVVDAEGCVIGILSDRDVAAAIGDPLFRARAEASSVQVQSMKVNDVMSHPAVTVLESTPVSEVVWQFIQHRIGALPVVNDAGLLVGILSYVDVLRRLAERPQRYS